MVRLTAKNVKTTISGQFDPDPVINAKYHDLLRQELSYMVDSADYSPAFKQKKWDGRISLYNKRNQTFPTGLMHQTIRWLKEEKIPYAIDDERYIPPSTTVFSTRFKEFDRELRFYQEEACNRGEKKKRGIFSLATGAGKTFLSCELFTRLNVVPFLFIVPSQSLLEQTRNEFIKYLLQDGKTPHIGMIGDGVCDINPNGINVATYQSLLAAHDEKYQEKSTVDPITKKKISGNQIVSTPEKERKSLVQLEAEEKEAEKNYNKHYQNIQIKYQSELQIAEQIQKEKERDKKIKSIERKIEKECKSSRELLIKSRNAIKNRQRTLTNQLSVRELCINASAFIVDEAHMAAVIIECLSEKMHKAYYKYGLSIGPDSIIELKGGVFKHGWIGTIEDAFKIVAESNQNVPKTLGDYEFYSSENVQTRGWIDNEFGWKPVKKFIRHTCTKNVLEITTCGEKTILTDDHSIFKAEQSREFSKKNNTKKYFPEIKEVLSSNLSNGDILMIDDGKNWNNTYFKPDIFKIIQMSRLNESKVRVKVDLSNINPKDLGISAKALWQCKNRGKCAGNISLKQYMSAKHLLSNPSRLYCERANGVGITPSESLESLAYIMGFFLGDGWLSENKICFAVENSRVDEFFNILNNQKFVDWNPYIVQKSQGSCEIVCCSALMVEIFRSLFGDTSCYTKQIPGDLIMGWSVDARRQLLQGLIDSDGHFSTRCNKKHISYCTTSPMLAKTLLSLLRSLGIKGSINTSPPAMGGVIKGRQIVGKKDRITVGWSYNAQNGINNGYNGKREHFDHSKHSFIESKITKIQPCDKPDMVYDLEVEGHPSFVANGLLCHNSATPFREDNQEIRITGAMGEKIIEVSASDLIDLEFLVPPYIYMVRNNYTESTTTWSETYNKQIVNCWPRNYRIKQFAEEFKASGYPTLILVEQKEHGYLLESMIKDSVFVPGSAKGDGLDDNPDDVEKSYRRLMLDAAERNEIILIATQWANVGIDAPKLMALILAGSNKSAVTTYQQIGRILRPVGKNYQESILNGKPLAIVIDFMEEQKILHKHSVRRKKIYQGERSWNVNVVG